MVIHPLDNVEVNLQDGHKYALRNIACGDTIVKYGNPIGHATCAISKGEHVHSHNMKTNLSGNMEYTYEPEFTPTQLVESDLTFMGYVRKNGDVGIRNEVWMINTVGCVNKIAEKLAGKRGIARMSAQAVGGAVGWNPICLIIPCHRVVGADGSLTGYGGGIENKKELLELEGMHAFSNEKF